MPTANFAPKKPRNRFYSAVRGLLLSVVALSPFFANNASAQPRQQRAPGAAPTGMTMPGRAAGAMPMIQNGQFVGQMPGNLPGQIAGMPGAQILQQFGVFNPQGRAMPGLTANIVNDPAAPGGRRAMIVDQSGIRRMNGASTDWSGIGFIGSPAQTMRVQTDAARPGQVNLMPVTAGNMPGFVGAPRPNIGYGTIHMPPPAAGQPQAGGVFAGVTNTQVIQQGNYFRLRAGQNTNLYASVSGRTTQNVIFTGHVNAQATGGTATVNTREHTFAGTFAGAAFSGSATREGGRLHVRLANGTLPSNVSTFLATSAWGIPVAQFGGLTIVEDRSFSVPPPSTVVSVAPPVGAAVVQSGPRVTPRAGTTAIAAQNCPEVCCPEQIEAIRQNTAAIRDQIAAIREQTALTRELLEQMRQAGAENTGRAPRLAAPNAEPAPVVAAPVAPNAEPAPVVAAPAAPNAEPAPVVSAPAAPNAEPTPVVAAPAAPNAEPAPVVAAPAAPNAEPAPVVATPAAPNAEPAPVVATPAAPNAEPAPVVAAPAAPNAEPAPVVAAPATPNAEPAPVVATPAAPNAEPAPVVAAPAAPNAEPAAPNAEPRPAAPDRESALRFRVDPFNRRERMVVLSDRHARRVRIEPRFDRPFALAAANPPVTTPRNTDPSVDRNAALDAVMRTVLTGRPMDLADKSAAFRAAARDVAQRLASQPALVRAARQVWQAGLAQRRLTA